MSEGDLYFAAASGGKPNSGSRRSGVPPRRRRARRPHRGEWSALGYLSPIEFERAQAA